MSTTHALYARAWIVFSFLLQHVTWFQHRGLVSSPASKGHVVSTLLPIRPPSSRSTPLSSRSTPLSNYPTTCPCQVVPASRGFTLSLICHVVSLACHVVSHCPSHVTWFRSHVTWFRSDVTWFRIFILSITPHTQLPSALLHIDVGPSAHVYSLIHPYFHRRPASPSTVLLLIFPCCGVPQSHSYARHIDAIERLHSSLCCEQTPPVHGLTSESATTQLDPPQEFDRQANVRWQSRGCGPLCHMVHAPLQ